MGLLFLLAAKEEDRAKRNNAGRGNDRQGDYSDIVLAGFK